MASLAALAWAGQSGLFTNSSTTSAARLPLRQACTSASKLLPLPEAITPRRSRRRGLTRSAETGSAVMGQGRTAPALVGPVWAALVVAAAVLVVAGAVLGLSGAIEAAA